MDTWDEAERFLVDEADEDLASGGDVRPCLVAFRGDTPLLVAFLRPFAKGAYDAPVIELLALAAPLGADRLALSISGRASSMHDPIPPVLDGVGDLRQRVLCVTAVDGATGGVRHRSALYPFQLLDGGVRWGEPLRDAPRGWIPQALEVAVASRRQLAAPTHSIRRQALRCVALGHVIALHPLTLRRLGLHGDWTASSR